MQNLLSKNVLLLFAILFLTNACSNDGDVSGQNNRGWLIPEGEVRDGGPGKDGIPSVDNPTFAPIAEIDFLTDDDLVVAVKEGNEIRAYAHDILDWHEIVNDKVNDRAVSITYCPLTGTAIGWDRTINGKETTFGVSGLLYNSNLIPYDRETDSNWSQIRLDCVNGELQSEQAQTFDVLETTWATFKSMFPNALVMTLGTGFNRQYGVYPYGTYKVSETLFFPASPDDQRLHRKERVRGVIVDGRAKVYRFDNFDNPEIGVLQDNFSGTEVVVAASESRNFIVSFNRNLNGTLLDFTPVEDGGAIIMEDNEGNKWNIFGEAVDGPRSGERLNTVESFIGYWFSWGAFYPGAEIHS